MHRIKMIVMAMVAVFAITAVGASAASAANTGTISTDVGDCSFSFNRSAWSGLPPTWSSNITSIVKGTPCDVDSISGSGTVTKNSDGTANFSGTFRITKVVKVLGIPIGNVDCTYLGGVDGTWSFADPPTNSIKRFHLTDNGSADLLSSDGTLPCPDPVAIYSLDADIDA